MLRFPVQFYRRHATLPFESLIAFAATVSGILGLIHTGGGLSPALEILLPSWLNILVQTSYAISGSAMWVGIGLGRADLESFGIVGVLAGNLTRIIGIAYLVAVSRASLGVGAVGSLIVALYLLVSLIVRLHTLLRHETIVRIIGSSEPEDAA